MTLVTIAEARKGLADLVSRAAYGGERIVLSKHGKAACALVPMTALKALEELERREDEADRAAVKARRAEPSVPWERVKSKEGSPKRARSETGTAPQAPAKVMQTPKKASKIKGKP